MRYSILIAVAALFLAMQAFSVMHLAEHGFGEHKHQGRACDLFLHGKQNHATGPDTPRLTRSAVFTEATQLFTVVTPFHRDRFFRRTPRAPPVFA